jgi:hypothetical protein
VAKDITDAILKARSGKGVSAMYWKKNEQEINLIAAYEKWLKKGGVWSAAADKVSGYGQTLQSLNGTHCVTL